MVVPAAFFQLCYVTRSERRAVIALCSDAVTESGGSILDFKFFSNVSASLFIEIGQSRLARLADRLEHLGLVPGPETDLQLARLADAARTVPDQIASATVQITFVHDEPDLPHDVPAVPG